jgi:DNA mismatch repair ATPase MutS
MLHRATPRSLVIIDEFGKGTLTSDGAGLLSAILSHFASGRPPPRLLACTHLHELARPEVLAPHPQVAFFEMRVLTGAAAAGGGGGGGGGGAAAAGGGGEAEAPPVFLYRLAPGHSGPSFGLHCARACGLPEPLLERAAAVIAARRRGGAVPRLALPPLLERDARARALVVRLAAADLSSPAAAAALLAAAAEAEGGGGGGGGEGGEHGDGGGGGGSQGAASGAPGSPRP